MRRRLFYLSASVALSLPLTCRALEPEDIAVIFNTKSAASLQVARYYLSARGIPVNHLIPITCDAAENITEELYRTVVLPQVRKGLSERRLLPNAAAGIRGVKCLVTTYDVPLRILPYQATAAENAELAGFQKELDVSLAALSTEIGAYDRLAPTPAPATLPAAATTPAKPTLQLLAPRLNASANAAAQRISALRDPERSQWMLQFIQLQGKVAGMPGVLNTLSVPTNAPNADAGRQKLAELAAQFRAYQEQFAALVKQRDNPRARREIIDLREKAEGMVGKAQALDELITYLRPDSTESCFDNELALLPAEQTYLKGNWIPNPLNLEAYQAMRRGPQTAATPTLMVVRLDGSTPAKTQELIDIAVQTETKGLEGKLYFDARGLHGTDGYSIFDADIRRAADWLKQHSTMETILDDVDAVMATPKNAPDAALYCGWYSLHQYQDSAQWVRGAVGYHVASLEMLSLHDPHETGWTINLLNRGFAGTLGATAEPYLSSFPKPSLFFPLLLSGEFTQGEVWQLTAPMLSWRVGWVGDPLYNPFKTKPRVKTADLLAHPVLKNAFDIVGRTPSAAK